MSILIDSKKAEYIDERNRNYLRIKDAGRVFSCYYRERKNKIPSKIGKYILWISLVAGGIFAAIYYAIQIFN